MTAKNIAIEIDSNEINIYLSGSGVVLREPSVIAFLGERESKNVASVGTEAYELLGRCAQKMDIVRPFNEGNIVDYEAASLLVSELIRRVVPNRRLFAPINAILTLPSYIDESQKSQYARLINQAGIKNCIIINNTIAAAAGLELPLSSRFGGVIVNIGGGGSDIAVVALNSIISSCGLNVGGNSMDKSLISHIANKYGLKMGYHTALAVRERIASLYKNDAAEIDVSGVDTRNGNPLGLKIFALDTLNAYAPHFECIADTIMEVVNRCPPEVAADVHKIGINISGECCRIAGVEEYFISRLRVPCTINDNARYATINGAGRLLGDPILLQDILDKQ